MSEPDTLDDVRWASEEYHRWRLGLAMWRESQHEKIRRAYAAGHSTRGIAEVAGISHQRVQQIVSLAPR